MFRGETDAPAPREKFDFVVVGRFSGFRFIYLRTLKKMMVILVLDAAWHIGTAAAVRTLEMEHRNASASRSLSAADNHTTSFASLARLQRAGDKRCVRSADFSP